MKFEHENKFSLRLRPYSERFLDGSFRKFTFLMASIVAVVLLSILIIVYIESREAIHEYGIDFLITSDWDPIDNKYGAFTAIYGTIVSSIASLLIAIPLGVGTAIMLTEKILPKIFTEIIAIMIELLAAIPSVILGLWAVFVMEPFLRPFFNYLYLNYSWLPPFSTEAGGPSMAPAILILVVMILPIITSISRNSLEQVPNKLREASYGVGATRWATVFNIILPAGISGISGGVLLALGRAMGETMAVTMIIGNSNNFSWSLFSPGYTISALLANQFGEADGIQVSSLMYAAFVLMIMTLSINIFAQWLVRKLQLRY